MLARSSFTAIMAIAILLTPAGWLLQPNVQATQGQTSTQLERRVLQAYDRADDLDRLEVQVRGTEATVSGVVPHLYAKNEAIQLALAVDGIETVASDIELPEGESDEDIVEAVSEAIRGYAHYTMWDYLDGRINEGRVTVSGSVTPDRDKKGDLYDRITKIRGVQDYVDQIDIQSSSSQDERLRSTIARSLFRSQHFERFRGPNPPFHIVVNNSIVTLLGYVPTQIEYLEMQRIVGQTQGVLRVDNQLQALR